MKQYIVDAFTREVFHGNQAAVCVLDSWPSESLMMSIAFENNFSETAFTVREGDGYRLRWFTPNSEVDLCGLHGDRVVLLGQAALYSVGELTV